MSKLHDADWRATADLLVPRPDEPHLGTFVAAGQVVPEDLRDAVEALEAKPRRRTPKAT